MEETRASMKIRKNSAQLGDETDYLNHLPDGTILEVRNPLSKATYLYKAHTLEEKGTYRIRRWYKNDNKTEVLTSYMVAMHQWKLAKLGSEEN